MKTVLTIGRSSGCDIILTDMSISREHARVSIAGGKYVFENLGRNGSYIQGRMLGNEKVVVAPGTEILLSNRVPLPWEQIYTLMPLTGVVVERTAAAENTIEMTRQPGNIPAGNYNPPAPVEEKKTNGLGIAGFIISLVALIFFWVPILNFILPPLGLIFSFIAVFRKPRGLAITGLVLSVINAIAVSTFWILFEEVSRSSYYYY